MLTGHLPQIRYATGFSGSSGLALISRSAPILLVDSRYTAQALKETRGVEIREVTGKREEGAALALRELGAQRIGFEAERTSVAFLSRLQARTSRKMQWLPQEDWLDGLRAVKEAAELARLQKAAELASHACLLLMQWIRPGRMELEIAAELECWMRKQGAEKLSFDPVIASGPRSGFPHSRASACRIPRRGWVVVDFGAVFQGYSSDMTRTFHLGKPDQVWQHRYRAVRQAQELAIASLHPGQRSDQLYLLVQKFLKRRQLDTRFTHGLGHGIGLELHESPSLSCKKVSRLEAGMVMTVEPGIYFPGRAGMRIEDMVLLTPDGARPLTEFPRDLIVL